MITLLLAIEYSNVWVNNNGNVTFDGSLWHYIPGPLSGAGMSIIAPYWADVDTDNSASDVGTRGNDAVDNHAAFGVDCRIDAPDNWQEAVK